jgi:hypothetical protein
MAHLWVAEPRVDHAGAAIARWSHQPLAGAVDLGSAARLQPATTAEGACWVLLGPPSVRVNGQPASTGIVVLRDRDEICTDGRRVFFSSETLAVVTPYPGAAEPLLCPRCRIEITAGTPAVCCPGCRTWLHQNEAEELPCWTHAPFCTQCDQPTALDAGFRWSPEG